MKIKMLLVAGVAIYFSAFKAQASDKFFVRAPLGNGADDASAMTDLVGNELRKLGHETTNNPSDADFEIQPRALKMGAAFVLTLEKIQGRQVVKSDQLKAQKLDEMDTLVARLTRAVVNGTNAEENQKHKEISDEEITRTNRRLPARSVSYFEFGGGLASNWRPESVLPSFVMGRAWDLDKAILQIEAASSLSSVGSFWVAGLGGRYLFSGQDVSPFLGANFGYGVVFDSLLKASSGFALTGQAGIHLFRLSQTSMTLTLRYSTLLGTDRAAGAPGNFFLTLGLIY
ncbi:MAG: hypothetical protein JNL01_08240 [Bdellovibrionales bacterium]|nr:hypothetical protein [Bdellovibrionales bacterium]